MQILGRVSRTTLAIWAIPVSLALFVCVNLVASLTFGSATLDLTEDGIYSVSDATREVLEAIEEPITLRLYRSSALISEAPDLRVYSRRVAELLRTYENLSGGMVRIETIDPEPFSVAEDRAIGYSLVGFNLSRAGEQGYFGLVGTNAVDQLEVIDVLSPSRERDLEYMLTRMIVRLSTPTEPRIGVIDGLGLFGDMAQGRRPSEIIERLGDDFALVPIEQDAAALPEGISALVIVHPHALTQSALEAIDKYVAGGGPALIFLDPLAEHSPPDPSNQALPLYPDSSLDPLLAAWGLSMAPDLVVGDIGMAIEIRAQAGPQIAITRYPPWLIVDADNLSDDDTVTSGLSLMRMSSAGALEAVPGALTTFAPLVETTPATMLYEQLALMRRDDPRQLVEKFESSESVRTLAARITGIVESALPRGPLHVEPVAGDAAPDGAPTLTSGDPRPINVIVVADTDMLADDHNVSSDGRSMSQNADFVVNGLDSLMGGGALYELRARSLSYRPFTLVDRIEAEAEARYRATEQQLQAELRETEARLAALRPRGADAGRVTHEQELAITDFNRRLVEIREELRDVRAALRRDIEALTNRLRLVNVLAMPGLVAAVGVAVSFWRRRRLAHHLHHGAAKADG